MTVGVTLEPDGWIIRGGKNHRKWGDPADFTGRLSLASLDTVWIRALSGSLPSGSRTAIAKAVMNLGFQKIVWEDALGKKTTQDLDRFRAESLSDA